VHDHEDKDSLKALRMNSKKNALFAGGYVDKIVEYALGVDAKVRIVEKNWSGFMNDISKSCMLELASPSLINEERLNEFIGK
jgi:hypothetical protein